MDIVPNYDVHLQLCINETKIASRNPRHVERKKSNLFTCIRYWLPYLVDTVVGRIRLSVTFVYLHYPDVIRNSFVFVSEKLR